MTLAGAARRVRSNEPPSPSRRRYRLAAVITAVVIAVVAAAVVWAVAPGTGGGVQFVVVDRGSGEGAGLVVYERPVELGATFTLEHTHSVTKRPVTETFSVSNAETIALEELRFDEFGANLPAGPEVYDHDVTYLHEAGGYRVLHHGFPIGTVPLRVGSADVDHVLTFPDGERVRLLDIARRGAWVDLTVRVGQ